MHRLAWHHVLILSFLLAMGAGLILIGWSFRNAAMERIDAHQAQFDLNTKAIAELELARQKNEEQRLAIEAKLQKLAALPVLPELPRVVIPDDTTPLAKSRIEMIHNQGKAVEDLLRIAEKELAAWKGYEKALFQEDAGRRIASDKTHVRQVTGLLEKERPAESLLKTWRDQLHSLLQPVAKVAADEKSLFLPSDGYVQDMARLEKSIRDFVKAYESDRQTLEAILADSQGNKLAEKGLKQASEELAAELAKQRAVAIAEMKKAAFEEVTKKLADAEADAIRLVGAEKTKQIQQKAELDKQQMAQQAAIEKARIQGEIELARLAAEKEKLKRLAQDPTIQAKYQAFLKPGHYQFNNSPGGITRKSTRPEPVSLSDLSGFGWLKDSKSFAVALSKKPMGNYNIYNDRPTNPTPRTVQEWELMDQMLEEFRMLAPLWVEMKLLRP